MKQVVDLYQIRVKDEVVTTDLMNMLLHMRCLPEAPHNTDDIKAFLSPGDVQMLRDRFGSCVSVLPASNDLSATVRAEVLRTMCKMSQSERHDYIYGSYDDKGNPVKTGLLDDVLKPGLSGVELEEAKLRIKHAMYYYERRQ